MQLPENFNANINECIKAVENIGSTTYHNICTGREDVVPWGAMTWIYPPLFLFIMVIIAYCTYTTFRGLGRSE